jgi:hypothetical protein
MNQIPELVSDVWQEIIYNSDVNTLIELYSTNQNMKRLLNSPEILDYLIKTHMPNRKIKSGIYNFPDFVDAYDRYYGNEKCLKKNNAIICFINACRHGTVADIIRYSKVYKSFNEDAITGFFVALEKSNFPVVDYIYSNYYDPQMVPAARVVIKSDPNIENVKWLAEHDTIEEIASLLVLGTMPFDCVLWIINYLNKKNSNWFNIGKTQWFDYIDYVVAEYLNNGLIDKANNLMQTNQRGSFGVALSHVAADNSAQLEDFFVGSYKKFLNFPYKMNLLDYSIGKGNFSAVKWLIEKRDTPILFESLMAAIYSKNDQIFEYIFKKLLYNVNDAVLQAVIGDLVAYGYFEGLGIILKTRSVNPLFLINYIPPITNNLELVDLIIENAVNTPEYEKTLNIIFNDMTEKGDIQGLDHLLEYYYVNQNMLNKAAVEVAHYGNVKMVNWLLNNGATNLTQIMQEAINSKAENVVEYLLNRFPGDIDLYNMVVSY